MKDDRHSTILAILMAVAAILLGLVLLNRYQPQPPVVTPTVTPSRTLAPDVSPTLTIVAPTATATFFTPTERIFVTDTVTKTEKPNNPPEVVRTATVAPTSTPVYRIIKLCHPRQWWQACYWRCCE